MADLLPPNATPLEQAWSEAIGQRLDRIEVPLRSLWDPQTCPLPLLPWLAWALSVDAWDPAWDEQTKRRVVSEAIAVHRVKGTTGSLRRALDALGAIYDLEELSGADHHRIRLTLRNSAELALHGVSQIVPTVERVKRASVHYTLRIAASTAPIRTGYGAMLLTTTRAS